MCVYNLSYMHKCMYLCYVNIHIHTRTHAHLHILAPVPLENPASYTGSLLLIGWVWVILHCCAVQGDTQHSMGPAPGRDSGILFYEQASLVLSHHTFSHGESPPPILSLMLSCLPRLWLHSPNRAYAEGLVGLLVKYSEPGLCLHTLQ